MSGNDVPEPTDVSELDGSTLVADPAPASRETAGWRRLVATRPRRLLLVAVAVVALVAVGSFAIGVLRSEPSEWTAPTETFDLAGPETIGAGDAWNLVVDRPVTDATLTVTGPTGSTTVELAGTFDDVTVDGYPTEQSGLLTAIVRTADGVGTASVTIEPGEAVDGITPLAGPRSMTADREHWTMVTAFARDRFGNAVTDGTIVEVIARHPDGSVESIEAPVQHLLAAVRVFSETLAGRTTLRVDVDGATGDEVEVLEVPGPPISVDLLEPTMPLRADGRQLVEIRSDVLVDQFGNELLDGTVGVVQLFGPSGRGTLRTVTIDGRAEFVVEAPSTPGSLSLELTVDGVRSDSLVLNFGADVTALPVEVDRTGDAVALTIGPVLTELGGFVPDGTIARILGVDHELELDVVIADGMGVALLDPVPDDLVAVDVAVLGARERVEIP
ncbi:MAG: hypothetical protein RIB65_19095 [Ilumatobacter fluminis]